MSSVKNESPSKRQKSLPPPHVSVSTSTSPSMMSQQFPNSTPLAFNASNPMVPAHATASNTVQLSLKKIPTGKHLKLSSADALLAWLKERMNDEAVLASGANLLSPESMEFTLEGRQQAMNTIESCLKKLFESATKGKSDRRDYPFPVCSAMSGIGKTRLLDEWVKKLNDDADIWRDINFPPTEQRLALVLSYGNGHSVVSEERSMGAHAGFAWRLLYAIFLERNSKLNGWQHFWTSLPRNADELTLGDVFKVIQRVLGLNDEDKCALFVGIDEYQRIPPNHVDGEDALANFLDAMFSEMTKQNSVVMLPMFAGTDWSKMSLAASASTNASAAAVSTKRVRMPLLDTEAMRKAVYGRGDGMKELLLQDIFCRHLFFLGGVPRPCTEYADECLTWHATNGDESPHSAKEEYKISFEKFVEFFDNVYSTVPSDETPKAKKRKEKTGFTLRELIWLVAYSVNGAAVTEEDTPFARIEESKIKHLSFRRLRDGSVCILGDDRRLQLPYCFFYYLSKADKSNHRLPPAEDAFMDALKYLGDFVDYNVFNPSNAPWQQWELFGACFVALRINALCITSATNVSTLKKLFNGAETNVSNFTVRLKPMRVVQMNEALNDSLPASILLKDYPRPVNWIKNGLVVLNGDNGKGIDIFYTLELYGNPGNYVLIADQRKRVQGDLNVPEAINKARAVLQNNRWPEVQHVVVALFSMFTLRNLGDLPPNSIAVTFDQHKTFHGALHLHPAASVCVRVNVDNQAALEGLFCKSARAGAQKIIQERSQGRLIVSFENLQSVLGNDADNLWGDAVDLCSFSC
jgi:hypothetical protein